MSHFWIILAIFVVVFIGIFSERIDKGILAVAGAVACILFGGITEQAAGGFVDFQTLSLLLGMMVTVGVASDSGVFELISVKILKITQGRPLLIFLLFMTSTLLMSSFLNNVTTILILLPLTIEITRGIGLNAKPFVLGEIFFANIGGLLTLIGDPVNTIVGSAGNLGMSDFMINMSIPVFLHFAIIVAYLYFLNKGQFKSITDNFIKVFHNQLVIQSIDDQFAKRKIDMRFVWSSSLIMAATIVSFLFSDRIGLTAGTLALIGAAVTMLWHFRKIELDHILSTAIEWKTLLFFAGLFVIVGAVEQTGILEQIAHLLESLTSNPYVLVGILLVMTGVVSAFIDNIPFVTIMIPIIRALQAGPLFPHHPEMLWWALSLGAVMGGMASPFGSSANVVAIGVANKSGFRITTPYYLKNSLFVSFSGLLISYVYLITFYEF